MSRIKAMWLLVGVAVILGQPLQAQDKTSKTVTLENSDQGKPAEPKASVGRRDGLTALQARRMGATQLSIMKTVRQLAKEGEIDEESTSLSIATAVAIRLQEQNPEAFEKYCPKCTYVASDGSEQSMLDLSQIIEFIERLIPLIMKIIDLFTYCAPSHGLAAPYALGVATTFTLAA